MREHKQGEGREQGAGSREQGGRREQPREEIITSTSRVIMYFSDFSGGSEPHHEAVFSGRAHGRTLYRRSSQDPIYRGWDMPLISLKFKPATAAASAGAAGTAVAFPSEGEITRLAAGFHFLAICPIYHLRMVIL